MLTLAPTITWRHEGDDGGELAAASTLLGIPHPPGYPTYTLLGRLFILLLPWGDAAHRLNLMSAVFAAAATPLVYLALLSLMPKGKGRGWLPLLCAAFGALSFAVSPVLWSQAVIAEVYALNAFWAAALLYLILRWGASSAGSLAYLLSFAFLFGLGLGNHLTLVWLGPPALLYLWLKGKRPSGRQAALGLLSFILGLAIYLYLPLRAGKEPLVNWGGADSWGGFWWMVTGGPYRSLPFSLPLSYYPARLEAWLDLLGRQFTWAGIALGILGLAFWWRRERPLALFSLGFICLISFYALTYNTTDSYLYLLPAFLVFSLGMGWGAYLVFGELLPQKARRASPFLALLLFLIPIITLVANYSSLDLSRDTTAYDYAKEAFQQVGRGGVILADTDRHIFSLMYLASQERETAPMIVAIPLLPYPWYVKNLRLLYPPLSFPPEGRGYPSPVVAMAAVNLPFRPGYITDPDPFLTAFVEACPEGPLYRLQLEGKCDLSP